MVNGYCEEKFVPLKEIFKSYFKNQDEIGGSFAIYKNGKPLIDIWGGFRTKEKKEWDKNSIVNVFSATKGIYEILVSILIDQNILDLEKSVSYYWDAFKESNKRDIKLKHILSHQSGLYRFKEKITQQDLLDWNKIISILEKQSPDHNPGEKTFYHAKTHGFLVGEIIKRITNKSTGTLIFELISKKLNLDFFIGTPKEKIQNIAFLYQDAKIKEVSSEFNAFNNPEHDIDFYNKENWQISEVPSMNGHGNASSIAQLYDIFVNDLVLEKKILLSKSSIKKCLTESVCRNDESLMLPIRWTDIGLILRGGWLFGKHNESFGHNGWGGSLGFADPVLGIGVSYTTNKINPTMGSDQRIVKLLKRFYEIMQN